jgi:hypothetical protein
MTQLEWLMLHLEPHEALELRAACDSFKKQGVELLPQCPVCWLPEESPHSIPITKRLAEGFIWRESPQGHEYWSAVYGKYKALESHTSQANDNKGE